MVSSSDLAKVVLREHNDIFAIRDPLVAAGVITYGCLDILWSDNNSYWRNLRKVLVYEVLSPKNVEGSRTFRRREARKTINDVYRMIGSEVNISKIVILTAIRVVTSMLWGTSLVQDEESNNNIDRKFRDIVTGGTDTTSTMVEWTIAELLQNPTAMKKVQDELEEVVGLNNIVEESHLSKLHQLDAVIKETLRLHPPLPLLIPRCPSQSCNVGGYTIPKGSDVYLNLWSIHRDPKYWDNPSQFNHNRFLNLDGTTKYDYNGNNFNFLPFGSGRRRCPGILVGEKMLVYLLASLLHSFNWALPSGKEHDLSDKFGIVLKKREPLVAIPLQRLSSQNLYM